MRGGRTNGDGRWLTGGRGGRKNGVTLIDGDGSESPAVAGRFVIAAAAEDPGWLVADTAG